MLAFNLNNLHASLLGFCNIRGDFLVVLKVCDKLFIIFFAHA